MSAYIKKSEVMKMLTQVDLRYGDIADAKANLSKMPTISETEIIRKPFERVLERLEECEQRYDDVAFAEVNENGHTLDFEYAKGKKYGVEEAIEIVKEECGISE